MSSLGHFASNYDLAFFCIFVIRYVALFIASMVSLVRAFQITLDQEDAENDQSLLENSSSYGTFPSAEGDNTSPAQSSQPKKSAVTDFYEKMLRLLPFLWPNKKPFL
ncbi:9954_t:CDS:1, partial [Racocetra fulgida]